MYYERRRTSSWFGFKVLSTAHGHHLTKKEEKEEEEEEEEEEDEKEARKFTLNAQLTTQVISGQKEEEK